MKIVTKNDMMIIDKYISEQNFTRKDTRESVVDTFVAIVSYGMPPAIAINNIEAIVSAMRQENK